MSKPTKRAPMNPWSQHPACCLLLGLAASSYAPSALSGELPAPEQLMLEVVINGTQTHELLSVLRSADGSMQALAGDLRHLRISVDASVDNNQWVTLSSLKKLVAHYNEAAQVLTLELPDSLLASYDVTLRESAPVLDLKQLNTTSAGILNYGLYETRSGNQNHLAASAEALISGKKGIFATSALYDDSHNYNGHNSVRLDSYWRDIDGEKVRSYTVGDFTSNALSWSNSLRLAGVQWGSAFEQRSDIVTTALPQFSGSAALPSTLDLYVNQQKVYSGVVPSGPFDIKSLPYITGNNVTLVATDATGRQQTSTQSYYYTASLLRAGLLQFSVDAGVPRYNYGFKDNDYDNKIFMSGSTRYGVTNNTTIETHTELSQDGLGNIGAALAEGLAGYGVFNGALSASHYQGQNGLKTSLGLEGNIDGVQMYASTLLAGQGYFDLAREANIRLLRRSNQQDGDYLTWLTNTAQARRIDRLGINATPVATWSMNLGFNHIVSQSLETRTVNLSVSHALSVSSNLSASIYSDLDNSHGYGAFLTFNMQLGSNINASVGVNKDGDNSGYSQHLSGIADQQQGAVGWGITNNIYTHSPDQRSAYLSYQSSPALLRGQVSQYGTATNTELSAEGSLLASGAGLFAANKIGDAYAIVKNGGPHVNVLQGGVLVGKTDSNGSALLPNIRPYYEQPIYIDPTSLPDGWTADATERTAMTGYRQGAVVDFGARVTQGAIVILRDSHGELINPGYSVQLAGGKPGVMGYDGEVYLQGLNAHNQITVDLGPQGSCHAQFDYDAKGAVQPTIGPVTCL